MNRRGFFARIAQVAAGAAVAPVAAKAFVAADGSIPTGDYFVPSIPTTGITGTIGGIQRSEYAMWRSTPIATSPTIAKAYRDLLGREATIEEVRGWLAK